MENRNLTNVFSNLATKGGIVRILSPKGGATQFLLSYLQGLPETVDGTPSGSSFRPPTTSPQYVWVSDEVMLYPPAAFSRYAIRSSQWLFIQTPKAQETWRVTLEAIQSGLFKRVFLRPAVGCAVPQLRKLQLAAEKFRTQVFVLGKITIPHWMVNLTLEVDRESYGKESETDPLSSQLFLRGQSSRGMLPLYA